MPLDALQAQLEAIYQVDLAHRVDDFLITDAELANRLDTSPNPRAAREKLLVQQQGDDLNLSLYIDPDVIEALGGGDAVTELHDDNLAAFCTALEGVSHFLYLGWNATNDRSVTQLELELQAEVDKYVSILTLVERQGERCTREQLHQWLFAAVSFDPALDAVQLERYRTANRFAARYCERLNTTYLRRDRRTEMYAELRSFYRETQAGKIRMAERVH